MASHDADRPNVLFILADDLGAWGMGCAGNDEIRTPNLDRLAATGIRFEQLFCVSPVCSPARASILTGRIPSQHGIHDWLRAGNSPVADAVGGTPPVEYLQGDVGYTDLLAAHGYTCGLSGKWHLGDSHHPQKGFRFWRVHATGGGPYYGAPLISDGQIYREPGYVSDVFTDNALTFLEQQARSESPFYLSVHYTAPHSPWNRDNHPGQIYDAYFRECDFRSTPDEPMHPWQINSAPYGDEPARRQILSGYFTAVSEMDRNVGRLIDWLERERLRENTLVIFTGDNGMNMGHHGIYGKGNGTFPQNMYDTSVKVPGIVSRPGHVPADRVSHDLLSHYDLMPTLCDYLGIALPDAHQRPGRSFAPVLRGMPLAERDHLVVFDEYGPVRMIRNRRYKYVHRYPYGPHELYDVLDDPNERNNLVESDGYGELAAEMKRQLDEWFLRYVDPSRDGAREPVTGKGQLGPVGRAATGHPSFADDFRYLSGARRGSVSPWNNLDSEKSG